MHLPIKVKSPNNISKWHMGINSAFKGLNRKKFVNKVGSPQNGEKEVNKT
jgi:hypothetical protein